MSEPPDPPTWLTWFTILAGFSWLIRDVTKKMLTWPKTKLKEFWGHTIFVIIGLVAVGFVINLYSSIQVDLVAIFLGLFSNFENSYIPAIMNTVVLGVGITSSWMICDNTRCCIRVWKTGDCVKPKKYYFPNRYIN